MADPDAITPTGPLALPITDTYVYQLSHFTVRNTRVLPFGCCSLRFLGGLDAPDPGTVRTKDLGGVVKLVNL